MRAPRRQLALLDHALGSLARRGLRSVTLAIGIAFATGLYAAVLFVTDSLRHEFASGARTLPDLTVQRLVAGRPALVDAAFAERVARIPAVASARPRVWGYVFVPSLSGNLTVIGASDRRGLPRTIGSGRAPVPGARGEVLLGEVLADFLGVRVGDEIGLPGDDGATCDLRVVGTFRSDSALLTADVLYGADEDVRCVLGVPAGQATDVAVSLTNPDEAHIVASKIADLVPFRARILDKTLLQRTYELTFDRRAGLVAAALLPALAALLLLGWDRLTSLGELERREIGLLKAVGWQTADVLASRMWESIVIALAGAALGLAGAYVWVFVARAPGLAPILFGWSTLHPAVDLVPRVDLGQVLAIVATVVVPFVAVSVVPAWRTAMLDPDRAMRGVP